MLKVNLWEVRTAKGLKLEAVAVMTGVSKSTLNNIENGKTSPTLANLEKIAKGLGCRISDLYDSEYKQYIITQLFTWYSCKYFHNPGNVFKIRDEQKKQEYNGNPGYEMEDTKR